MRLTKDSLKNIVIENIPFDELEKNSGIYEFYRSGDLSIGVSFEDLERFKGEIYKDVYVFNLFYGPDEYVNIDGEYKRMADGSFEDIDGLGLDVLAILTDTWNSYSTPELGGGERNSQNKVLLYDRESADKWTGLVDVMTPQEVANNFGKPVRDGNRIYMPESFADKAKCHIIKVMDGKTERRKVVGYWTEIRNDYFEGDFNPSIDGDVIASVSIDAWKTTDENEPGEVIACVMLGKHGDILVDYRDGVARSDERAQEAISEARKRLAEHYEKNIKDASQLSGEKVSFLCEEYEGDDGIREFRVIAVSKDKDSLRCLLEAKIAEDEYGFIAHNGVNEHSADSFCSEFNDGFVSYYIIDEFIKSKDEIFKIIGGDTQLLNQPEKRSEKNRDEMFDIMKGALDGNVKCWYLYNYSDDSVGHELNDNISFDELYKAMKNGQRFYDLVGDVDTVVRERVFSQLAKSQSLPYRAIYDLWINEKRPALDGQINEAKPKVVISNKQMKKVYRDRN